MQRAIIVFLVVVDIALICLIVQTLIEHNRMAALSERIFEMPPKKAADKDKEKELEFGWGTVAGRVVWAGKELPERKPIDVSQLKEPDPCFKRTPPHEDWWVVNPENKGVRWTFVWLAPETIRGTEKLLVHPELLRVDDREVAIDQPCYAFVPHALALRHGQKLAIKNSSSAVHRSILISARDVAGRVARNIRSNPGETTVVEQIQPDIVPLGLSSTLHPWMKAWVGVFDHPYFALTDENGRFEIKQAPSGRCRLKIWHESVGWRDGNAGGERILIKANETTPLGDVGIKPLR